MISILLDVSSRNSIRINPMNLSITSIELPLINDYLPDGLLALFPGSTVPHKKYVHSSLEKDGEGTNRLMTGRFEDYRKGYHKAGKPTCHEAFRQENRLPIRRTGDDMDYDEEDRVEFVRPFDNIHAAWCSGVNSDRYASTGCQVIIGYPKCDKLNNSDHVGPWKIFNNNAYSILQPTFTYVLLNGRDAMKVSAAPQSHFQTRLRYGLKVKIVGEVQNKLKEATFYEGKVDNDLGLRTLFAMLDFKTSVFGNDGNDGVVGPMTASALEIDLQ